MTKRAVLLAVALGLSPASAAAVPKPPCASSSDCKKKCEAGALDACWGLGVLKAEGREGFADEKGALELFKKACDGGFALACASQSAQTKDPAAALALARKACDGKAALGCVQLAVHFRDGTGVAKDPKQALAYARRGCDGGEGVGCIQAGVLMVDAGDASGAVALLDKTCQGGVRDACHNLAVLLLAGKPVAKDEPRAVGLLEKACALGSIDDCELAARLVVADKKDDAKAAAKAEQLTRKACELGSGAACYLASVKAADPAEKARWAEKACGLEVGEGCYKVGILAEQAKEFDRAVEFHDEACRTGWKAGCESATTLIGLGGGKAEIARPYFDTLLKACEAGQFAGCDMPVRVLRFGHPAIAKDVPRALAVLGRACEAKDAVSCAALARLHRDGLDVPKDKARAEQFEKKACALDATACELAKSPQAGGETRKK